MRVVFTGGPCSGKTTLLQEFSALGFYCIPESALIVIKELCDSLGNQQQALWRQAHPIDFHYLINQQQLQLEQSSHDSSALHLMDRSRIDTLAYLEYRQKKLERFEPLDAMNYPLDLIFYLLPLSQYKQVADAARVESQQEAMAIAESIQRAYQIRGYDLIAIPDVPVTDRVNMCLQYFEKLSPRDK